MYYYFCPLLSRLVLVAACISLLGELGFLGRGSMTLTAVRAPALHVKVGWLATAPKKKMLQVVVVGAAGCLLVTADGL